MYCFQIHVSPPFSPAPQGEEVWQRSVCCSSPPYCRHKLPMLLLRGSPGCFNFSRLYFTLIVLSLSTETVSHRLPDAPSVGLIVFCQLVVYSRSLCSGWLRKTGSLKELFDVTSVIALSDRWSTWISLIESFCTLQKDMKQQIYPEGSVLCSMESLVERAKMFK